MTTISLTVNGQKVEAAVEPRTHLADFLREQLRLTGTHLACEHGVCGACTVLLDGSPVRSCITFAAACDGAEVTTIEGFDDDATMVRLREAFTREHALQCGFCTPGMLITARDIVERLGPTDERRLRIELSGNLCRCTGYAGIVKAVASVAQDRPPASPSPAPRAALAAPPPPAAPPASVTAAGGAPVAAAGKPAGGTVVKDSFRLPQPPDEVWTSLQNLPLVASCLPGAELVDYAGGDHVRGRVAVKLGPIAASFDGEADVTREPEARRATVRGGGRDRGSGSRATGTLTYSVAADGVGSRVDVVLEFSLTGALAQFGRSNLAKAFVGQLVAAFAANLVARLQGEPAVADAQVKLDLGRTAWLALVARIKDAIARLFRR